ncbi:MFS transporter OS=Lysinibacillus sphaericus OX=1421 GN=LS41612_02765 PE=3 SV=1 [Lysinibacillus sphaericus]
MTTLQPVVGAIGVAVFISIMNAKQNHFLQKATNPSDPSTISQAMVAGVELVYLIAFIITIVAIILAFTVYRAVPKEIVETHSETKS